MSYSETETIKTIIENASTILVMQADNPDADSLGSALALEEMLGDLGKQVHLYCGVHIPDYLHYIPGWDRVSTEVPISFDASIIVDTSADSLFGILNDSAARPLVASKPCIVIDHHAVEPSIPYASVVLNPTAVATGEVLYELAQQLDWPLNAGARRALLAAIMSDSLGLTSEGTSPRSIHIVAELAEAGTSIAELEASRRELMRKSPELLAYKGRLLERVEYHANGRIAIITIPWAEIEQYSYAYNPSMLVLDEMRNVTNVQVALAFKVYNDGKITAKIRCNYGSAIAADLAKQFGGGGHPYASGFKIVNKRPFIEVKNDCIKAAGQLLDALPPTSITAI
ncbi:MAG TPA: DHH family phosphoesterase [Candidatus Limnocylindrales bacterium]|nr:DHH family phosphoesterase [Candidatus Limnocylindrales bacterium]